MTDQGRNVPGHWTDRPGRCRFAIGPQDIAPERVGAHPRDPRMTATEHPSSDISGVDALADTPRGGLPATALPDESQHPPNEPGTGSEDPAPRVGRGPDTVQRVRRTFADQGSGPVRLPDWTRFDIQISLKNLRSWNPV